MSYSKIAEQIRDAADNASVAYVRQAGVTELHHHAWVYQFGDPATFCKLVSSEHRLGLCSINYGFTFWRVSMAVRSEGRLLLADVPGGLGYAAVDVEYDVPPIRGISDGEAHRHLRLLPTPGFESSCVVTLEISERRDYPPPTEPTLVRLTGRLTIDVPEAGPQ